MNIALITPAAKNSRAGNRATAERWSEILRSLGHSVEIKTTYSGEDVDLMIALHAWRSADAISLYKKHYKKRPLIVAITGTDAYRYIHSHSEATLHSIELADYLVGLHDLIAETIPKPQRKKMHVIKQSAKTFIKRIPDEDTFKVCVSGHLRDEKDSLRPAFAVRALPQESKIQIEHYGKAHTAQWEIDANHEININQRYHWHGQVNFEGMLHAYKECKLLVLPSRMEGGANVISEAIIAGIPIIASNIHGSIGLLGKNYPGYYQVENEEDLKFVLLKAETNPVFYQSLIDACHRLKDDFSLESETKKWSELLQKVSLF